FFQRARAAFGENRYQVCIEDLDRVLGQPAGNADERKTQRDALLLRGRAHLNGTKDFDHAIADLTRVLDLDANSAEAFNLRGIAHGRKQDYARAAEDYSAAMKLAPRNSVYASNRGYAHLNGQKVEEAIKDFTKAIELNPKYPLAYE